MKTLTMLGVLVATFVLAATPSSAQDNNSSSLKEKFGTALLRVLYVSTPIVQAVDGISTLQVIERGGRETNPFMQMAASNQTIFGVTKAGISAGEILGAHSLARRHKFVAIALLATVNSGYVMLAVHNFDVARLQSERNGR